MPSTTVVLVVGVIFATTLLALLLFLSSMATLHCEVHRDEADRCHNYRTVSIGLGMILIGIVIASLLAILPGWFRRTRRARQTARARRPVGGKPVPAEDEDMGEAGAETDTVVIENDDELAFSLGDPEEV